MCMCVHLHVDVYVYVHLYVYLYVCVYLLVCIYLPIYICMYYSLSLSPSLCVFVDACRNAARRVVKTSADVQPFDSHSFSGLFQSP